MNNRNDITKVHRLLALVITCSLVLISVSSARAEVTRCSDYNATVSAAEIVDNVVFSHIGDREHCRDNLRRRWFPVHIWFAISRILSECLVCNQA